MEDCGFIESEICVVKVLLKLTQKTWLMVSGSSNHDSIRPAQRDKGVRPLRYATVKNQLEVRVP